MGEFEGRTVLVTGGGGGIGGATARLFGQQGARVVVTDIDTAGGEATAAAVSAAGGEGVFIGCDMSEPARIDALFDEIFLRSGPLHHAVNCAGMDGETAPEPAWDLAVFQRVFAVNVQSVFCCMRREIEHMRGHGGGTIVNVSSALGLYGSPTKPIYTSSKHAIMGLTRSAGLQYGRYDVRINAICPGGTRTDMVMPSIDSIPGGEAMMNATLPLRRMAEPEEVGRAIMFLSSEAASYMAGAPLHFDGGFTAGMTPWGD